jgi:methyl-accepting chemotaxis protein
MKSFEKLSISRKISLTVLGILCVTLSLYLVIFFVNNDSKVNQRIENENQQLSSLLTESIRMAMAAGADDTVPFVKSLQQFEQIKEVRITPTELINANTNNILDSYEKKVLDNNTEASVFEEFKGSQVLRSVKLLKADNTCTDCHDVSNGDVLAVVSIRSSLDATYSELLSQKIDAAWIGMIAAIVTFMLVSYFVNKKLGKPIEKLTLAAKNFANGKFDENIKCESNDELGILASSFNEMAEKIYIQIQYLNNLPIPVLVIDKEFNISYINEKGAALLLKNKEKIVGTKCYDNLKSSDCNTNYCACKIAINNGTVTTRETTTKPNSVEMPILYSGAPIKNKKGEVIGALEAITDLTDAKEKENYLEISTKKMLKEMEKLAQGDLTVNLVSEKEGDTISELFEGFNKTVENIREMILQVGEAISATAIASSEISSSSEQMAAGAQEQSSQAEEVAGAIEQMTRTIVDTTQNISTVANSSKEAGQFASDGSEIVNQTIVGMNRISEVVNDAAKTIETLGQSSDKIGQIIKVINEIADQTNLLALNAAIEAARAGEHGRGFAVVADEVRKLAERTTGATTEISDMISTIQSDTKGAVKSIYSGTEEVNKGRDLASQAGESLEKINESTLKVIDLSTQVATASEEQSATSEQIYSSVENINNVTQESTLGLEQIAKAAEDLNGLTENLQNMMKGFKVNSKHDGNNYVHINERDKKQISV